MRPQHVSLLLLVLLSARLSYGQRTPTISYITSPAIVTSIGGTIEMDCSVLYSTEYPVLWVKLPRKCAKERVYDIRAQESDLCTPIPLSSGTHLIIRDHRFA